MYDKSKNYLQRSQDDTNAILFAAEMGGYDVEVDYHGMDIYSSLHELDSVIDEAFMNGESVIRIIHGAGTGKLREAIHERLESNELVEDYRRAPHPVMAGVTHAVIVWY